MAHESYDLVVIGAGPGGYVAAIRAAQLGWRVACIEKEPVLGGTCLRVGCIPSKAMLESSERFVEARDGLSEHGVLAGEVKLDLAAMLARKEKIVQTLGKGVDGLLKKNKITRYLGHGRIEGPGKVAARREAELTEIEAQNILIATGSKPASLPGIEPDGDRIGTSTEALAYGEVPRHLAVIGAGYIGLELGSVWRRLGSKVTILEYLDRILPGMDTELASDALKVFKRQGLDFQLGSRIKSVRVKGKECVIEREGAETLTADRVLLAVGRTPNTENLGLESVGIKLDERKRISVDKNFATSAAGVYAIGDVIGGAMLAHKAEDEGVACIERLVTGYGHVNYDAIPGIVYTHPEIASVGKTEEELKSAGVEYVKGTFPFRANGRALCLGDVEGRIKMLTDAKTDRILGVHIIGPRAGDLIAEAAAAIEFGASGEDLARTPHAHPTLSEALREAALATQGRAIHF